MEEKMCQCASCGHEAMCEVGSACTECGSEMKEKMEGGADADAMGGSDDMAGGDMPAADEKPME